MSTTSYYEIFAGIIMHFADINKLVFAELRLFSRRRFCDLAGFTCESVSFRGGFPGILTA